METEEGKILVSTNNWDALVFSPFTENILSSHVDRSYKQNAVNNSDNNINNNTLQRAPVIYVNKGKYRYFYFHNLTSLSGKKKRNC